MTDNKDELLVKKFFEGNRIDLPDDGFSHRVMRRLPDRERRLNRLWTALCVVVGVVCCVKFDWIGGLSECVSNLFTFVSSGHWLLDKPYMLWLLLLSVIFLGGYKAIARE